MLNVTTGPFVHICQDNLRAGKYTNKYLTITQTNIFGDNLRAGKYTNKYLTNAQTNDFGDNFRAGKTQTNI